MHIFTDLRCVAHVKFEGKRVCQKYKIHAPRVYCKHYRMVNQKRVCAETGVFYNAKSRKLICTKRAKSMKVLSAKTVIVNKKIQRTSSAKKFVLAKLDTRSCGCMDYKVVNISKKKGRKLQSLSLNNLTTNEKSNVRATYKTVYKRRV